MIYVKNNLLFGIIKTVLKLVYKIVKLLHLQIPMLVGLVGAILYFTGALNQNQTVLYAYYVALGLSVLLSIVLTFRKIFKKNKIDRKENMQIISEQDEKPGEDIEDKEKVSGSVEKYPKYYAVKQNKNYVMAEYADRYELYQKTNGGLKKIRTDYKS